VIHDLQGIIADIPIESCGKYLIEIFLVYGNEIAIKSERKNSRTSRLLLLLASDVQL
jgi:hypothetical protein